MENGGPGGKICIEFQFNEWKSFIAAQDFPKKDKKSVNRRKRTEIVRISINFIVPVETVFDHRSYFSRKKEAVNIISSRNLAAAAEIGTFLSREKHFGDFSANFYFLSQSWSLRLADPESGKRPGS